MVEARRTVVGAPAVTVVVPCGGVLSDIAELAEGLRRQRTAFSWEVIFVDNGLSAEERDRLERCAAELAASRIVEERALRGAGPARNAGARHARGDVLAFVDADDVPGPEWLAGLVDRVAPGVIAAGRLDATRLNPPWLARTRGAHAPEELYICEGVFPVVPSGNMAVSRKDFAQLGGFTSQPLALEDFDFSLRAWESGLSVAKCDERGVVHYRLRRDGRSLLRQGFAYGEARARIYRDLVRRGLASRIGRPGWKSWALLAVLLVRAPMSAPARLQAIWILGNRLGRLAGSWRHRVVYV